MEDHSCAAHLAVSRHLAPLSLPWSIRLRPAPARNRRPAGNPILDAQGAFCRHVLSVREIDIDAPNFSGLVPLDARISIPDPSMTEGSEINLVARTGRFGGEKLK